MTQSEKDEIMEICRTHGVEVDCVYGDGTKGKCIVVPTEEIAHALYMIPTTTDLELKPWDMGYTQLLLSEVRDKIKNTPGFCSDINMEVLTGDKGFESGDECVLRALDLAIKAFTVTMEEVESPAFAKFREEMEKEREENKK